MQINSVLRRDHSPLYLWKRWFCIHWQIHFNILLLHCWRRSLSGCDCKLTLELDLGKERLLIPSLFLECTLCPPFPQWETFSRM